MSYTDWRDQQSSAHVETEYHEFDIAYREYGEGQPVTLFIHGIPSWGYLYNEVYDAVSHAIVPDLPGYGYTEHLGTGEYDRSVRAQEEYLRAFLDELGHEKVQVVAHDIGGGVALRLAVNTDRVERLVLSNAVCYDNFPDDSVPPMGSPKDARNVSYQEVVSELKSKMTDLWGPYDEYESDDFLEAIVAPFSDSSRDVTDLARNSIALNTNHTTEIAPHHETISAPTLLLWGYPGLHQHIGWADRLAEDIPTTTKRYLPNSYHWVMQDRPEAYKNHLAEFLKQRESITP